MPIFIPFYFILQGDSGGPFITEKEDKRYELIGKFHSKFCLLKNIFWKFFCKLISQSIMMFAAFTLTFCIYRNCIVILMTA